MNCDLALAYVLKVAKKLRSFKKTTKPKSRIRSVRKKRKIVAKTKKERIKEIVKPVAAPRPKIQPRVMPHADDYVCDNVEEIIARLIDLRRRKEPITALTTLLSNKTYGNVRYYVGHYLGNINQKYEDGEESKREKDKKTFSRLTAELYKPVEERKTWNKLKIPDQVYDAVRFACAPTGEIHDVINDLNFPKFHDRVQILLVRQLPVWEWAKQFKGIGEISFGNVVSFLGDPTRFDSVDAMHKFCGLGVWNGHAQGKVNGKKITGQDAIAQGYAPKRQSAMIQLIDYCAKKHYDEGCIYNLLYRIKKLDYEDKHASEVNAEGKRIWPPKRIDTAAKRFAAKRFLEDLRLIWAATKAGLPLPDVSHSKFLGDHKDKIPRLAELKRLSLEKKDAKKADEDDSESEEVT